MHVSLIISVWNTFMALTFWKTTAQLSGGIHLDLGLQMFPHNHTEVIISGRGTSKVRPCSSHCI